MPHSDPVFVFGSNLAGRHGAGSAKHARQYYGAVYGVGVGMQGNSYAIPNKDENFKVLSIERISVYVSQFLDFARSKPELNFRVVDIGCGLAGYSPQEIAPLFVGYPDNVFLSDAFKYAIQNIPFNHLLILKAGWLDGHGVAPSLSGVYWLASTFRMNYPDDLPTPHVYPIVDGGIRIEWSIGQNELSMDVNLSQRTADWHNLVMDTGEQEEKTLNLEQPDEWKWAVNRIRDMVNSRHLTTEA